MDLFAELGNLRNPSMDIAGVSGSLCVLAADKLGDELCKYCPLENKGVYSVPGGFVAGCEGSKCENAYENYLDECAEANDR